MTKPYYSEPGIDLYQGDNREVIAGLGIKPEDVALLWGDPPYGVDLHPFRGRGQRVVGDDQPFEPEPWLVYHRAVLWGANHYADRMPVVPSWWLWDKKLMEWETNQADGELAWTNLGGPLRIFRHRWCGGTRASEADVPRVHPTQKTEALASWGFQRARLEPGDLVLSPWLGSGPEAAAAKRMGLRFIGIELVPEYLDACVDRLRQGVLFAEGV